MHVLAAFHIRQASSDKSAGDFRRSCRRGGYHGASRGGQQKIGGAAPHGAESLFPRIYQAGSLFPGSFRPSGVQLGADHHKDGPYRPGDIRRHSHGIVELRVHVHSLRRLSCRFKDERVLQRLLPRSRREIPGRPCKSGSGGFRTHGKHLGKRTGERGHHGCVYHSPDEAHRLHAPLRGGCGGGRQHGRNSHASHHGRGGLHHEHVPGDTLRQDNDRRFYPGVSLLPRHNVHGGPESEEKRAEGDGALGIAVTEGGHAGQGTYGHSPRSHHLSSRRGLHSPLLGVHGTFRDHPRFIPEEVHQNGNQGYHQCAGQWNPECRSRRHILRHSGLHCRCCGNDGPGRSSP